MEFSVPSSAYVHIPFCRRRCFYCDFPISVVGDKRNGTNSGTIVRYVEVLCNEIRLTKNLGQPLKTVFFGGGTPSLLSVNQLSQILDTLDQQFGILSDAEISMEVDPGTFDLTQIQGYRSSGINRVSLGIQAFQPELLTACGRTHRVEDVYESIKLIHQAGVSNFSLDLISGLPNQTIAQWQDSLDKAIALSPNHISIYDLTIEPMTAFGKRYQPGLTPLPTDEATAVMYRMAQQILTSAGYEHYEISNYARSRFQCRHNRVYWKNQSFYGFGMGATSYVNGDRVAHPRKTREYYEWVQKNISESQNITDPTDVFLDTLMVGLRLAEGLSLSELSQQFGQAKVAEVLTCLQPYQKSGWIEVLNRDRQPISVNSHLPSEGQIRLTDPEGFLFSNVILVKLFETFDRDL
ncbi:coproporphyrinogen III oxidase family protein [Phormidesmis priestleyi ULC007]|uniref:Heme chaperone HemW n=1 Tax=Phormidesmis priestleyi ULC007 TaxID=1920490 RepID=A0A2T1DA09_9CYAN|nr:radical SAM family heme chaperone HemW [Phormidesmis priestleyi]PSB17338.1 coproporphyrinogen III oxidase family protein [Phormidesmis priestleyi ULC007]PZO48308.1 MAG: coproporphyrinogen III oxidase family protein [Phormidesmis priestleyi]